MFFRFASSWRRVYGLAPGWLRFAPGSGVACHRLLSARHSDDHVVEGALDLGLEVGLDLVEFSQLRKSPPAERAEIVHSWHPVGVHRRLLVLCVLAPVALDLDD